MNSFILTIILSVISLIFLGCSSPALIIRIEFASIPWFIASPRVPLSPEAIWDLDVVYRGTITSDSTLRELKKPLVNLEPISGNEPLDVRLSCRIYYSQGKVDTLSISRSGVVRVNHINYATNGKIIRLLANYLPRDHRIQMFEVLSIDSSE